MFVAFTVGIYAFIGYLSRTVQVDAYYVAGRQVPTVFNGMATAADWMSGASFVALAGGVYFGGYPYMAFLVGSGSIDKKQFFQFIIHIEYLFKYNVRILFAEILSFLCLFKIIIINYN